MDIESATPDEAPRPNPDASSGSAPGERVDEFVRLLGQSQHRIFLFVMSMVPNWSDAEEIIQETNLLLWREFDRFQPGTNFAAWACRIALNQTLAWRKRKRRERLVFSPEFLEVVAEEMVTEAERLEERSRALANCIEKLTGQQQVLLRSRYGEGWAVDAIGSESGRSKDAVYRSLSRIRHSLYNCVTQALLRGDRG